MVIIATERSLHLLDFADRVKLPQQIKKLKQQTGMAIVEGKTRISQFISEELEAYFEGTLKVFKTPLCYQGSGFQQSVWEKLLEIPYGETRSYLDIAKAIGKPTAFRAVALANAANKLALIVPCHRVINHNGNLGGYGGGIDKKIWLLAHEKNR